MGPSGINSCIGSLSLLHLLVRIVAATATRPSLANSEGWIVTGPRSIHRDAPYSDVPDVGRAAIAISTVAPARIQMPRCFQMRGDRRATTIAAPIPRPAYRT